MDLNREQRAAAEADPKEPLLIIAGAGTGKTTTLAHRVAWLVASGADPGRILLLTFTRRAAAGMTRRAEHIAARSYEAAAAVAGSGAGEAETPGARPASPGRIRWSGTFHAIANRLLRMHAESVGLDPTFTVLDRSDSADLMNLVRNDLGLGRSETRFPRKGTCLAIYSHAVNTQLPLEKTLETEYPWCEKHAEDLRGLFKAYVEAKQKQNVLDYDDLLLYWYYLMAEPALAARVRERFDHVLVDEYQDTNTLQASILLGLCPDGQGVTVVGDDAQSIYSFRAASVRNILDFPEHFDPPARVQTLEQNYRSTQSILDACNAVIEQADERFTKNLRSSRRSEQKPVLASVADEVGQVDHVVEQVLQHRESGVPLKKQAVLMRAAHHSDALEVELARRNIPFVKYGGLKFLEAAHVKDVMCVLRFAENPRDRIAGFRMLQLLPGVGPANASRCLDEVAERGFDAAAVAHFRPPASAAADWPALVEMLQSLAGGEWGGQVGLVREWYRPHLERLHEAPHLRDSDLEQLEHISAQYASRERFLTDLTLDPPNATGDEAGPPHLDEDWLVLSTIHSAKGQEWDVVYVLNVVDGCIPSDMSTGNTEQIEEERRLLYVAMTRARDRLILVQPLRYYVRQQSRRGDAHLYAPRSRFLPDGMLDRLERVAVGPEAPEDEAAPTSAKVDVASRLRGMWDASP